MENVELALTIPATVTRQRYPEPNPAVVVHRIWVCATTTEHTALSVRPALVLAYTADTGAEVSPKLLPTRVADDPPAVARVTSGDCEVSSGAVYDDWNEDGALICPPTVTTHVYPVPCPGAVVHWI